MGVAASVAQHAAYLRDIVRRPQLLVITACVGVVSLLTINLMWSFLAGFLLQGILWTIQKTRENREGA